MWAADRVVAPTPGFVITIPETGNESAIKGTHLNLVKGNQFDGRTKTDPHKHILEFLRIYDMFKYRDTKNEAVRLMMFPLSLTGEAKTWLDERNKGTIKMWDELRTAFISRFFPLAFFDRLLGEIRAFSQHENESLTDAWLHMKEMLRNCHGIISGGIFLYKTPNQAYQLLKDKVLLKLDWAKNKKTKSSLRKPLLSPMKVKVIPTLTKLWPEWMPMTIKMDAQYKKLQSQAKQPTPDLDDDDMPISREEEAIFMQTFYNYRSNTDDKPYDLQKQFNDFMKSQQSTNTFVKETFMDLKTQLETVAKNHQASIQNLETKFDRLADKKSGRPSGSLPSNTQPNLRGSNSKAYQPPQARNEHVNVVFTRSGKSYNPPDNPNDQKNNFENPINFDSDDEDDEPIPQPKTQPTKPVKETPLPKPYKPKFLYPQRLRKEKTEAQYEKFLDMIRAIRINLFSIDVADEILEEDSGALLDEGSKILHSIEGTLLKEEIFFDFDEFMAMTPDENSESESDTEEPPFEKITINIDYKIKTSLEEPHTDLELKPFPDNLEYVFLEEPHSWYMPSFCKHKIQFLDDKKPVVQKQRRLNPNMQEVVKKQIVKLLDTSIIYPIADSPWVSPIHCVPKKGGITVVTNKNDELVPTRTITGWRVCIDYRKLNEATAKDHFPLPFMDQMLERLIGNKYLCFLDGFSGCFRISIEPMDQEKTTFTCPFGIYAYRRMPFGLCNAPGTFQRCMLAIFHDMIEESVEVFMDDFSVFGNSFDKCLNNLDKMLQRCKDAHLVLNYEKCHFMVKEEIVHGHKVSSARFEVDKAKINVILKLPSPTNIKDDHLSRIENDESSDDSEVDDNFLGETLMEINTGNEPWFVDFENYLVDDTIPKGMTYQQKNKFFSDLKHYFWEEPYLFNICSDEMIRRCVSGPETQTIFDQCHHEPTGGHYGPNVTAKKKKLFCRFRMPKALISDRGTHFCNKIMEKTMKRYGVNHRFSTSYHPQTSGQVKNTNKALKRILEKTVKDNSAIWSRKLDDAMWTFHTAYKTPTSTTPYKLIYGKNCHLPFEIEHRAYWALKNCNPDLIAAGEKRMFQLHELDELRHQAYEDSQLYKDIYADGFENRPPMLNKENYVPWSSRLLRRMIPEPGDTNREVPVNETFHIEADDQAIQTILLGLPKDIYATVDSCETAQEIWLRVQQMMKGSDIGIQEKKAKLFNEWERFTSTEGESIESYYHRFLKLMNDLKRNKHFPEKITNYTQLYDFLKYNQKEVDELKVERLAKTQDPLALMANSNNPYAFPAPHQDQPSFNQNYTQQPMPNPEDITYPTTAMNMTLALMAKSFKLKYSTPMMR
nr:reverse transcriptase domain-containing protein [Tanacetum cinerariifolium]